MINNSTETPYFKLTNNGPDTFAFDLSYMSGGAPIYAYSRPIAPGNSMTINLDYCANAIKFTVYVLKPPYQLIPIFRTMFNNACTNRCYLTSGTVAAPFLLRIPCFIGETHGCCYGCCSCCK